MLCWELQQRLSRSSPHPDVSVALENMKRSFSVPSENMKMSFFCAQCLGFCCVCCASAASSPHAALPWVLFDAASKTEKLRNHTHLQKNPKPFCSPRGKSSWELLACALQLKFQRSGDPWDVGWEALLSHWALHTWGPTGESLQGVFSASQALPAPQGK